MTIRQGFLVATRIFMVVNDRSQAVHGLPVSYNNKFVKACVRYFLSNFYVFTK